MLVRTLLKVLDDTKQIKVVDPLRGETHIYPNCKKVGIGYAEGDVRVVMVTTDFENKNMINIVVKPPKSQESETNDERRI